MIDVSGKDAATIRAFEEGQLPKDERVGIKLSKGQDQVLWRSKKRYEERVKLSRLPILYPELF